MCTLLVEKGTFTKETSNVDGTDQTVTLANSTLTPKVLWLWSAGTTSSGSYTENQYQTYGFSDGTTDACILHMSLDNAATSSTHTSYQTDSVIVLGTPGTATTISAEADVLSFGNGSFTLNWSISDANATVIHYMVVGGTDITNVKVLNTAYGTTSTGNKAYTGVGFQGDFGMFIGANATASYAPFASTNTVFNIGAATSSSSRWVVGIGGNPGQATMDTWTWKESGKCLSDWVQSTGGVQNQADFVSWDADGFTLNYNDAPPFSTSVISALIIKGGLWDVGSTTAPASTGNSVVSITSGRAPRGVQLFGWGDTTMSSGTGSGAGEANSTICIGGGDYALHMGCTSADDRDNVADSVNTSISLTDKIMRIHTANATAASSTTVTDATLSDMSSTGQFTLNFGTTSSGLGMFYFSVSRVLPAASNLLVEKGTFAKRSGTGSQTITLGEDQLTPKVLWLWTAGTTTANTYAEHYVTSYGYSDGTNDACFAMTSEDNAATSDQAGCYRTDSAICILNTATPATVDSRADVTSFNAGNFILNWAAATSSAEIIHYMVAGGSDITNVKVTNHTLSSATGTGNEAYTGVGFQPDFLNLICPFKATATAITANTPATDMNAGIGAATSSSARWALTGISENAAPTTDTYNAKEINKVLLGTVNINALAGVAADLATMDSDGFTLNYSTENLSVNSVFGSLAIKGGLWNVGNGTAPASTGSQTINTTSGRFPEGVMMFTWGDTSTSGNASHNRVSIGGADASLNEGCISTHDTDGSADSVNTRISLDTKIIRAHTANATAGSSTTLAEADITDMDNDGNFVINWTTTLSGMGYVWFALSASVATTSVSETSIHKYNLAAYIAETNIHKYNMIGNTLQSSIHKYHILNNIAQTNIHKYNLLQNILQTNIHKYNLFAYALQTSIHKYNLFKNILQTIIHKYDMLNFVPPATSVHKYNLFKNIAQTSIHKYNLLQNILQSSIHKYDILALAAVLATSIHKYSLLEFVSRTSIHKYNLIAYIAQTSIHKYNLLQNLLTTTIHKYNLLQNALQSSIHKYNLLKNVLQSSIHKYSIVQNILQGSIHKYNVMQNILQSSIHKYDIIVLGAVINTSIQKYNLLANIVQTNIHKYHLLNFISQTNIHKYSLIQYIAQTSIQKYNLLVNALQSSIHKYNLLQNVIQTSIHKYDILTTILTVLQNSIHKYNILNTVSETSKHKYNILQNVARNSIHKYHILTNILQNSIHKYHMGGKVVQDTIHRYKIVPLVQEIFSSRIMGRGPARIPKLKEIRYPVYSVTELKYWERRRKLRQVQPYVVIPAFKQNIHRVIAPFVLTNAQKHTISVKFAVKRAENVRFSGKIPVPIVIKSGKTRHKLHTAKAPFVMNQRVISKYGNRLNKLAKMLKLLLLAENNPFKE